MKQILVSAHAFNMATIPVKGAYAWPESHTMLTQPIDVWWVVHDGGLLLLLSVILRKHRTWHRAPLRVFCVCHADDDPLALHASIKAFLYEMRISAKLQVSPYISPYLHISPCISAKLQVAIGLGLRVKA